MQWSAGGIQGLASSVSVAGAKVVLAFNEPDNVQQVSTMVHYVRTQALITVCCVQANMTPGAAASCMYVTHEGDHD
jgi:hypothetical protein